MKYEGQLKRVGRILAEIIKVCHPLCQVAHFGIEDGIAVAQKIDFILGS